MSSWSEGPFQRVEQLGGLRPGRKLSEFRGQSRRVCVLDSHPGWIYKEYSGEAQPDAEQLDRLISFPGPLTGADRELVDRHASWPTSRVVTETDTVGVLLPQAPDTFQAVMSLPGGPRATTLEIDFLVQRDEVLVLRGIPPQPLANRVTICSSLVAMAALFERHGIVYLDWSYANAFWSTRDLSAYVIDVDGCSFGPRPQIDTPGWEDPLVPQGSPAGHPTDRYRVALMVARCLTAERTPAALAALEGLASSQPSLRPVHTLVARALQTPDPQARPPATELAAALAHAAGHMAPPVPATSGGGSTSGVIAWVPVRRPDPATRPTPLPTPQPVPGPPAPWTRPMPPVPQPASGMSGGARATLITVAVLAFFFLVVLPILSRL